MFKFSQIRLLPSSDMNFENWEDAYPIASLLKSSNSLVKAPSYLYGFSSPNGSKDYLSALGLPHSLALSKVLNIQSSSLSSSIYSDFSESTPQSSSYPTALGCTRIYCLLIKPNLSYGLPLLSAVSALSPLPISHSSKSLHLPIPIICWWRVKSVLAIIGPRVDDLSLRSPTHSGLGDFFLGFSLGFS